MTFNIVHHVQAFRLSTARSKMALTHQAAHLLPGQRLGTGVVASLDKLASGVNQYIEVLGGNWDVTDKKPGRFQICISELIQS